LLRHIVALIVIKVILLSLVVIKVILLSLVVKDVAIRCRADRLVWYALIDIKRRRRITVNSSRMGHGGLGSGVTHIRARYIAAILQRLARGTRRLTRRAHRIGRRSYLVGKLHVQSRLSEVIALDGATGAWRRFQNRRFRSSRCTEKTCIWLRTFGTITAGIEVGLGDIHTVFF
jgi:hypothetical protein